MGIRLVPLLVLLCAAGARADALEVELFARKLVGSGPPELAISIHEPIEAFELELTRSDGVVVRRRAKGAVGSVQRVRLPQPEGTFSYRGHLRAHLPGRTPAELPLAFETEIARPPRITLAPADVDPGEGILRFRLSRPASHARLRVRLDTGEEAFDAELPLGAAPAGTPLEVRWPPGQGRVLRIDLQAFDTSGFHTALELFPWRLEIPHEEVHFASGQAVIAPDQAPRLEASRKAIAEGVARYGHLAALRLYVLGHTDTVGGSAENRALSARRARAIGAWFKSRGIALPIRVAGRGEDAPRVATPDETDEPQNRRAEYILAIEDPPLGGAAAGWKKL